MLACLTLPMSVPSSHARGSCRHLPPGRWGKEAEWDRVLVHPPPCVGRGQVAFGCLVPAVAAGRRALGALLSVRSWPKRFLLPTREADVGMERGSQGVWPQVCCLLCSRRLRGRCSVPHPSLWPGITCLSSVSHLRSAPVTTHMSSVDLEVTDVPTLVVRTVVTHALV